MIAFIAYYRVSTLAEPSLSAVCYAAGAFSVSLFFVVGDRALSLNRYLPVL
jgi:hypothetical protein